MDMDILSDDLKNKLLTVTLPAEVWMQVLVRDLRGDGIPIQAYDAIGRALKNAPEPSP